MSQFMYFTEKEVAQLTAEADTVIDFMGDRILIGGFMVNSVATTLVTQFQVCDGQIVRQQMFIELEDATAFVREQITSCLDDLLV